MMFLLEVFKIIFKGVRTTYNKMIGRDGLKYPNIGNTGHRRCWYTETPSYWLSVGLFMTVDRKLIKRLTGVLPYTK